MNVGDRAFEDVISRVTVEHCMMPMYFSGHNRLLIVTVRVSSVIFRGSNFRFRMIENVRVRWEWVSLDHDLLHSTALTPTLYEEEFGQFPLENNLFRVLFARMGRPNTTLRRHPGLPQPVIPSGTWEDLADVNVVEDD